jgi:hypothetical protein
MDDLQIVGMTMPRRSQPRTAKKKRKAFEANWVRLPRRWIKVLQRAKSAGATYELAHSILAKAFECEYTGQEIVLSAAMTGMPKNTRIRAAKELARLKLIKLHRRGGGQAPRVSLY